MGGTVSSRNQLCKDFRFCLYEAIAPTTTGWKSYPFLSVRIPLGACYLSDTLHGELDSCRGRWIHYVSSDSSLLSSWKAAATRAFGAVKRMSPPKSGTADAKMQIPPTEEKYIHGTNGTKRMIGDRPSPIQIRNAERRSLF